MIRIRTFQDEDAEAVAKLVYDSFRSFLGERLGDRFEELCPQLSADHYRKTALHSTEDVETVSFVAEEDGQVVGFLQAEARAFGLGSLNLIATAPGSAGKGIGSSLFEAAYQFWTERRLRKIITSVAACNKTALAYYLRHDFVPEGYRKDHFFPGVDDIELARFLHY